MSSFWGTSGNDTLTGTDDDDYMSGEGGNDHLSGLEGDDELSTWDGADTLDGGNGDDTLFSGAGDDRVLGGSGDDYILPALGNDHVDAGDGNDLVLADDGTDTLLGGAGNDTITLRRLGNKPGGDFVDGGDGDDILESETGLATLEGGMGNDRLTSSSLQDFLSGGAGDDTLLGNGGDDSMVGGTGNDTLRGGDGADTMLGGDGDDVFFLGSGDRIDGGNGSDYLVFSGSDPVKVDLNENTVTGSAFDDISFSDIENVMGTSGDDTLVGNASDNYLNGSYGDDILIGGAGDDTLHSGGQGARMTGGSGADLFVISDNSSNLVISDFSGAEGDRIDLRTYVPDMEALSFTQQGRDTKIYLNSRLVVTLEDTDKDDLTPSMLVFTEGDGSFFETTPAIETQLSGFTEIDALLMPYAYSANTVLTFGFPGENSIFNDVSYAPGIGASEPNTHFVPLSDAFQELARQIFQTISTYTDLDFLEKPDTGSTVPDIRIATTGQILAYAWTYAPNEYDYNSQSDIWLGGIFQRYPSSNGGDRSALYHEIGHSIGLKHPFHGDVVLDPSVNGNDYTIMSYTVSARHPDSHFTDLHPTGFMQYDIKALQYLYGVDTVTTGSADTYRFDLAGRYFETLWDAGGIDTLEITGTGAGVNIDLTPGSWSNVGTTITYWHYDPETSQDIYEYESFTLFIADDTIIENATGAGGNDRLRGNEADNILKGMAGADSLIGGAGADTLHGGAGNDQLWAGAGDAGDDRYFGGAGDDIMGVGAGNDLAVGEDGQDVIFGGAGDDTLVGGFWTDGSIDISEESRNEMWAGSGSDIIHGANGSDALGGGAGSDKLYGYGGNDILYAGGGTVADTLDGGTGQDTLYAGAGDDLLNGDAGDDLLFNGAGEDTVAGGGGNDTLWGGAGDDMLTGGAGADMFAFTATNGSDTITDFDGAEDILLLENSGFADLAALKAAAIEDSNGVTISFGDTMILISGISLNVLTTDNVML